MSTGLTFGTIAALFGYSHGYISTTQYTVLVTVVILSAIVPTMIAQRFFQPRIELGEADLAGSSAVASLGGGDNEREIAGVLDE
jgi:hypothetical protein